MTENSLGREFFEADTTFVARHLLGKLLTFVNNGSVVSAVIVETEAYLPSGDLSSHSAPGLTRRNAPMFESGGIAYIYQIYGIHHCFNIVTGTKGSGSAVLIRAAEPISGVDTMSLNRGNIEIEKLCCGPGNFCKAFGFNTSHNFLSCRDERLNLRNYLLIDDKSIACTPRIGITKSSDLMLRFLIKNNKFVSCKRF